MQEPLCVTSPPASPGASRQTATTGRPAGGSRGRPGAGGWRAAGGGDIVPCPESLRKTYKAPEQKETL